MWQIIIPAIAAIVGVIIGALFSGRHQLRNTKMLIESEMIKLRSQLLAESRNRIRSKKEDLLFESVPKLLVATDPQLNTKYDYHHIVSLIHQIQICLDTRNPAEANLNHVTSELGFTAQAVICKSAPPETLLGPNGQLIDASRAFFSQAT